MHYCDMQILQLYEIKPVGDKFAIIRPDGSKVNEVEHVTREQAERHLRYLVAFNYCRSK